MNIQHFNQLSHAEAIAQLQHCVNIRSWFEGIAAARPFASQADLLGFAKTQADSWCWQDIQAALDTHPKIGEKKAVKDLSQEEQLFSDQEQANIQLDQSSEQQLLDANLDYQNKFGFIFLIKAAGLTTQQIMQQLQLRLTNSPEVEKPIVHQNLTGIALLRLSQLVTE